MSPRDWAELTVSLGILAAITFPVFRFIFRGGRP